MAARTVGATVGERPGKNVIDAKVVDQVGNDVASAA